MTVTGRPIHSGSDMALAIARRGLSKQTIREAFSRATLIRLRRGEELTGGEGGLMCLVTTGHLRVQFRHPTQTGGKTLAGLIGPQDFFAARFDKASGHATSAAAMTPARVLAMPSASAYEMAMTRPDFNNLMLAVFVNMTETMGRRLASLLNGDAAARVAWVINDLMTRFGQPGPDGLSLGYRVTQTELAQLCGLTRETVNKTIADFANRGWLTMHGHSMMVHDLDALRQIAS